MTDQGRWDGSLYAANSEHHRGTDARLIADLALRPNARVLDLGCGTGEFAARLATLVPDGEVIGVDASADMIATASARHPAPNLRFVQAPAQSFAEHVQDALLDAVVSVACLHWVPESDHPAVLAQVASVLRPGGVFRADFGGCGQIAAPRVILDEESAARGGPTDPWFFPLPENYRPVLEGAGLDLTSGHVRLLHQRRPFADADAVVGMLRSQTYMAYDAGMDEQTRSAFHRAVDERAPRDLLRHDGTYDLDFVRMDVLAHRR
jgi:trans-aconitate methyltransferase